MGIDRLDRLACSAREHGGRIGVVERDEVRLLSVPYFLSSIPCFLSPISQQMWILERPVRFDEHVEPEIDLGRLVFSERFFTGDGVRLLVEQISVGFELLPFGVGPDGSGHLYAVGQGDGGVDPQEPIGSVEQFDRFDVLCEKIRRGDRVEHRHEVTQTSTLARLHGGREKRVFYRVESADVVGPGERFLDAAGRENQLITFDAALGSLLSAFQAIRGVGRSSCRGWVFHPFGEGNQLSSRAFDRFDREVDFGRLAVTLYLKVAKRDQFYRFLSIGQRDGTHLSMPISDAGTLHEAQIPSVTCGGKFGPRPVLGGCPASWRRGIVIFVRIGFILIFPIILL